MPVVVQEQPEPNRLNSGWKTSADHMELVPLDAALKSSSLEKGSGGGGEGHARWQHGHHDAAASGDGRQGAEVTLPAPMRGIATAWHQAEPSR